MAADPLKLLPLPTPNPTQPATVSPNPITTVTSLPHSLALPPLGPSDPWADEGRSPSPSPTHQWMDGDGAMMARWRRPPWRTRAGSRPSPPSPTCWRLCSRVGPRRRRKESTAAACTSDDPVYEFITSDTVYSPQVSCWRPGPVRSARIEGGRALVRALQDGQAWGQHWKEMMWLYQFQHDDSHQLAPDHSPVKCMTVFCLGNLQFFSVHSVFCTIRK
ncbi:hypothetical protein VPH35_109102 [Triticum aestivum]